MDTPTPASPTLHKEYIPIALALGVIVVFCIAYLYSTSFFNSETAATQSLSESDKLRILENLEKGSPPPPSIDERRKIINTLSAEPAADYQYSTEGKLQILRQLEGSSQ